MERPESGPVRGRGEALRERCGGRVADTHDMKMGRGQKGTRRGDGGETGGGEADRN